MTQHDPPSSSSTATPPRRSSTAGQRSVSISGDAGRVESPSPRSQPRPVGPRSPTRPGSQSNKSPLLEASLPAATSSSATSSPSKRDRAGSSRTTFATTTSPSHSPPKPSVLGMNIHAAPEELQAEAPLIAVDDDMDGPHAPYRPPEAFIEPDQEPPPGYVPGVVEEHMDDDDDIIPVSPLREVEKADLTGVGRWQADVKGYDGSMDIDDNDTGFASERPQIGPGMSLRRMLQKIHEHDLYRPTIKELPQPSVKKHTSTPSTASIPERSVSPQIATTSTSSASPLTRTQSPYTPSLPDYERICTVSDVWEASPGGESGHGNWYFCMRCWSWMRIEVGRTSDLPKVDNMDEWEQVVVEKVVGGEGYPGIDNMEEIRPTREKRREEWGRFNDIKLSRMTVENPEIHLHEFRHLLHPGSSTAIPRVPIDHTDLNAFPHITMGEEIDPKYTSLTTELEPPKLFISCSSDFWVTVEEQMPGQIPAKLAGDFNHERLLNPPPGVTSEHFDLDAWTMLSTLVGNPLFKGQRGWVNLSNARFQRSLGMSQLTSLMLYHIGFGCRQEPENLRVGPFLKGEYITADDVQQMDRYMLRVWLEIQTFMAIYKIEGNIPQGIAEHIGLIKLEDDIAEIKQYPRWTNGYPWIIKPSCDALGVANFDHAETVEKMYDLQISCDIKNVMHYLSALTVISEQPVQGKENLQMKVAIERSMGRSTLQDVAAAYSRIGYTPEHASLIDVEANEAPQHYLLELHKKAMQSAANQNERNEISQALALIGKHRGPSGAAMQKLGESGQTMMSVEEAYAALSAPRNADDEGLMLQYRMALEEFPGKAEHYRTCLSIIVETEGGDSRPDIKRFLETGSESVPVPVRKDIPVGLHNIGNTCYLNSILQYLYSIKPLREAVMAFEQDGFGSKTPRKAEVERSRRFVRQLRHLFLQLYHSEGSSVRPDEELAYLAITRPEIDAIVEPSQDQKPALPPLSSIPDIPDMPSPSSTRVATPEPSPPAETIPLPASSPTEIQVDERSSRSVLGKRQSQDRESSSSSKMGERSRQKSEGFEDIDLQEVKSEDEDEFELVPTLSEETQKQDSPSAMTDLAGLRLKSPVDEAVEDPMTPYAPPSIPPPLPARPKARRASTLASGLKFGLQQDSAEVLINVLTQLELAFDPSAAEGDQESIGSNLISDLFSCKYRQQMFVHSDNGAVQAQTPVESVFVHPIIGVEEEGKDLYDCLAELYLAGNEIEYEGSKGYIMDLMESFPPMLYIQMRRSQFDISTGRERKTNTHIPFEQTLAMDRFLSSANSQKREQSMQLTRDLMNLRSRLHQLRDHKPLSIPATFTHVKDALQHLEDVPDLDLTPDFYAALDSESKEAADEIERLAVELRDTKVKLDDLWKDEKAVEYELVAVFMHRGRTSGSGHYWTYQAYLPDHNEKFFKYNDESVTEVPSSEVLMDRTGSDANPALLCYVRKDRRLVDTLHREILEREALGEQGPNKGVETKKEGEIDKGEKKTSL